MPFARDKVLINWFACLAMWKAIKTKYKSLKRLTKEIDKYGWIKETGHFRDEMKGLCADKLKADQKYLDGLAKLESDMADFIDTHP